MRPKRSSASSTIRSAVAGSDDVPVDGEHAGSPAGSIVRDAATTAQPRRRYAGDEAGADALGTAGDDGDLAVLLAHGCRNCRQPPGRVVWPTSIRCPSGSRR